jgi:hypothetical protein
MFTQKSDLPLNAVEASMLGNAAKTVLRDLPQPQGNQLNSENDPLSSDSTVSQMQKTS